MSASALTAATENNNHTIFFLTVGLGGEVPNKMGEEAPSYYVIGRRGGYGNNNGGDYNNIRNLYGRIRFGCPRMEEESKGRLVTAATTGDGKHGCDNGSRVN